MATGYKNLEKDAHLLSGGERARLIIKDRHDREYKNGRGFFTPVERKALKHIIDGHVQAEYDSFLKIYEDVPNEVGLLTAAYFQFKCSYEGLKKFHLLLSMSPAIRHLSSLINEHMANEDAKKEALMVVDALQTTRVNYCGSSFLGEAMKPIASIVKMAANQSKVFFQVKKLIEGIDRMMGFNIFMQDHYPENCRLLAKEIRFCIGEHNRIMSQFGTGMADLDDYFIPDPEIYDNKQQGEKNA